MKKRLFTIFAILFSSATAKPSQEISFRIDGIKTLDSALITAANDIFITSSIYEGLVRVDEFGKVLPATSDKWESKGNKIIFHIRKDAKWSNGDKVTAYDFEFAFKRVLSPDTAAEYSFALHDTNIVNARNFTEGKVVDFSKVGVKALNDSELELTLLISYDKPVDMIAPLLSFVTASPVKESFYESHADLFGLDESSILCNGPWMVESWLNDNKIVLKKNPYYYNPSVAKLDKITAFVVRDENTALNMYRMGTLDMLPTVSSDLVNVFRSMGEYVEYQGGKSTSLHFNCKNKFLSNEKIRKAISIAIDRDMLCSKILKNTAKPAYGIVPEGFSGESNDFRKEQGSLFTDGNISEAHRLVEEAKTELKVKNISLSMIIANFDDFLRVAQFLQSQLSKIGIDISIISMSKNMRIAREISRNYDISISSWSADHGGIPITFFNRYPSFSSMSRIEWINDEFDNLIKSFFNSENMLERTIFLKKAERVLVDGKDGHFPIAPIYFAISGFAIKKNIKGVKMYIGFQLPDFRNAYVE